MESKGYRWAWLDDSLLLSNGACELCFVFVASDGQTNGKAVIYDGENTTGDMIATIESIAFSGTPFKPTQPVYCRKGLYVVYSAGIGVFVQWRELGSPQ